MAKHLLVVGSANADLYVEIPRLPVPGETLPGTNAAVRPGGKGANQAAAAARLGHPTLMLGRVGDDASGAAMVAALTGSGADARHVRTTPGVPTGTAVVMVRADGENSIVIVGGANTAAWGEAEEADATIATAGMLLLQREVSDAVNARVAAIAAAAGVPVLLDAGGVDAPPPDALLACVHTLSPNETELARLVGA